MATITKRGNSYRATISLYQKGVYKRETKTFKEKKDAELWTLEMELEKGRGKNIAERSTLCVLQDLSTQYCKEKVHTFAPEIFL